MLEESVRFLESESRCLRKYSKMIPAKSLISRMLFTEQTAVNDNLENTVGTTQVPRMTFPAAMGHTLKLSICTNSVTYKTTGHSPKPQGFWMHQSGSPGLQKVLWQIFQSTQATT